MQIFIGGDAKGIAVAGRRQREKQEDEIEIRFDATIVVPRGRKRIEHCCLYNEETPTR